MPLLRALVTHLLLISRSDWGCFTMLSPSPPHSQHRELPGGASRGHQDRQGCADLGSRTLAGEREERAVGQAGGLGWGPRLVGPAQKVEEKVPEEG